MTPYIIQGGLIGFLLVLALNILNDNGIGISIVRSCIAAVAFAFGARWFAKTMFSELHLSLWLQQEAAQQEAAQEEAAAAAKAAEAEQGDTAAAE
ncbi:MAG: hypothetical protein CMO79_03055 [Verrucomicrobiales bacterium]|nr:hypothetical protein [Verrucomicrobiales bacterium]|tara:strand:+ start:1356 stop:1640 length:285 start_codon:yes stop_codon:yes gene_type:complete